MECTFSSRVPATVPRGHDLRAPHGTSRLRDPPRLCRALVATPTPNRPASRRRRDRYEPPSPTVHHHRSAPKLASSPPSCCRGLGRADAADGVPRSAAVVGAARSDAHRNAVRFAAPARHRHHCHSRVRCSTRSSPRRTPYPSDRRLLETMRRLETSDIRSRWIPGCSRARHALRQAMVVGRDSPLCLRRERRSSPATTSSAIPCAKVHPGALRVSWRTRRTCDDGTGADPDQRCLGVTVSNTHLALWYINVAHGFGSARRVGDAIGVAPNSLTSGGS